jgi:hypothetical protein
VKAFGAARTRPVMASLSKADEEHRVAAVDCSAWEGPGGPLAARTVLNDVREALIPS